MRLTGRVNGAQADAYVQFEVLVAVVNVLRRLPDGRTIDGMFNKYRIFGSKRDVFRQLMDISYTMRRNEGFEGLADEKSDTAT